MVVTFDPLTAHTATLPPAQVGSPSQLAGHLNQSVHGDEKQRAGIDYQYTSSGSFVFGFCVPATGHGTTLQCLGHYSDPAAAKIHARQWKRWPNDVRRHGWDWRRLQVSMYAAIGGGRVIFKCGPMIPATPTPKSAPLWTTHGKQAQERADDEGSRARTNSSQLDLPKNF